MKKRIVSVLLTAAMVMTLAAGCGGKSGSESNDGGDSGEAEYKVALVVNQKFGDKASMDEERTRQQRTSASRLQK